MAHRDSFWMTALRYLSLVLVAAPLAGLAVTWMTVWFLAQTSDRETVLEIGNQIMAGLLLLAGVGLIGEFFIVPLILGERDRRRAASDRTAARSEDKVTP